MANHVGPQTCLSTNEHSNRVLDETQHYFACLKEGPRRSFFNGLPKESQRRIRREGLRIEQMRAGLEYEMECQPMTKAGALLKGLKKSLREWHAIHGRTTPEAPRTPGLRHGHDSTDDEIMAPMIFFEDSRPYEIPGVDNKFPNQEISIKRLLADDRDANPLMQPCEENMIRYFHLPANNMIWVEVSVLASL